MLSKKLLEEIIKFGIIGGISTAVNYGIFFWLFRFASWHYLVASALGFASGIVISYTGNRLWTFNSQEQKKLQEFGGYLLVCIITIAISLAFLRFEVHVLKMSPLIANAIAIALSAAMNFIFVKIFVFKKAKSHL